jgi:hypothetical protein
MNQRKTKKVKRRSERLMMKMSRHLLVHRSLST